MADVSTIAAAIKSELDSESDGGTTFNRRFEANVIWADRELRLEVANTLRVDVALVGTVRRMFSRGKHLILMLFHVSVRKRFEESEEEEGGTITDSEVNELVILLGQLEKFFMPKQPSASGRPLADFQEATVMGPTQEQAIETIILWDHLEDLRQFSGYFPLTIQVVE